MNLRPYSPFKSETYSPLNITIDKEYEKCHESEIKLPLEWEAYSSHESEILYPMKLIHTSDESETCP
ncbi:hypothetical protein QJS10_CPA10g00346 [Acorus calamus]|uniref:Uncharacterized protein n=1 Tax=Acorus calamus TaxID=4465 RepID=A0AAV9DZV8_ACOCL|nr:hypothetical protein QJS10_CPA10g00346 [Acorus calamus]